MLRVRLVPVPLKLKLELVTRVGLDEVARRIKLPVEVSRSETVNAIGPVLVSSLVGWLAMVEIAGGELTRVLITEALFARLRSVVLVLTLVILVTKPAFVAVTVIVIRASARFEIEPREQFSTLPVRVQEPW